MQKLNKIALIDIISKEVNISKKQAEDMINTLLGTITNVLQDGGRVTLTGFGTFSARVRTSRMGVNPQNPSERIRIDEVTVPKFKAGKALKDSLKQKSN